VVLEGVQGEKKKRVGKVAGFKLPPWVDVDAWAGFEEMRRGIKKPMTDRARELIVKQLEKLMRLGNDPAEVLDQSTRSSWQGVFEVKANGSGGNGKGSVDKTSGIKAWLEKSKKEVAAHGKEQGHGTVCSADGDVGGDVRSGSAE
jgi:hypothetical protein